MYLCVYQDSSVEGNGIGVSITEAYENFCNHGEGIAYPITECLFYSCNEIEIEIIEKKVGKK